MVLPFSVHSALTHLPFQLWYKNKRLKDNDYSQPASPPSLLKACLMMDEHREHHPDGRVNGDLVKY